MAVKITNVSIGDDSTIWTVDSKQRIWGRVARGSKWDEIKDASAIQVSVARGDQIWVLNAQGILYKREGTSWAINRLQQPVIHVSAGSDGTVYAIDQNQSLWFRTHVDPNWKKDPAAKAVQINVASKDKIWGLTANGDIYQKTKDGWSKKVPQSGALSLSVGSDGEVWYVGGDTKSYRLAGSTWVQVTDRPMMQISVRDATEVWGVTIAGELWQWLNGLWRKTEHPAFTAGKTYIVSRGDTLSGIALKLSIPYTALRRANPQIVNPDRIEVGQVINLPE